MVAKSCFREITIRQKKNQLRQFGFSQIQGHHQEIFREKAYRQVKSNLIMSVGYKTIYINQSQVSFSLILFVLSGQINLK